jgi:hypothetical protein
LKIPAFDLQRIDMQIRHEHVTRNDYRLRPVAWILPATMGKLVAATGRQLELFVSIGKADKVA